MSDRPIPPLERLLEHRTWVRAVARRLLRDEHAAEDLAQEAWVRAMRAPPDPERDPRPWLRRVLKNLASNRRRGEARRRRREATPALVGRAPRSPAELVAEAEQHKRLVGLVLDLEEPFKTALVLRFYEGLSPTAIAARLEVPVGTVHSRIARATVRLKARLDAQERGDRTAWIAALLPLAGPDRAATAAASAGPPVASLPGILLMTLTQPKLALLAGLCLCALVGGGIVLGGLSRDEDVPPVPAPATAHAATSEPTLSGRAALRSAKTEAARAPGPEGTAPVVPTNTTWRGRVLDHAGKPVAGAEVFALPDGALGMERDRLSDARFGRTRSDDTGRFRLQLGDLRRPRLVAWSRAGLAASARLAGIEAGTEVELRLGAPRTVRVRLEHAAAQDGIDVSLTIQTGPWLHDRTDDPARQSAYWDRDLTAVQDGQEVVARLHTQAPLTVTCDVPRGRASVPLQHVVTGTRAAVTFRVVPSARIRYRLLDAATDKPLAPGTRTTVYLFRRGTREVVASTSREDPAFEIRDGIPPGTYDYELKAAGHAPAKGRIVVREPGERIEGTLQLRPQPGEDVAGRLLLRLVRTAEPAAALLALARENIGDPRHFACVVLVRREGEDAWMDTLAGRLPDGRIAVRPQGLSAAPMRFESGVYDVVVAIRGTAMAGVLGRVRIFGNQQNELEVRIAPGTFVRLGALVGADEPLADLAVHAAQVKRLPFVEFRSWGWRTFVRPREIEDLLAVPRRERVLGPFPSAAVEVRAVPPRGEPIVRRVRGASEIER